MALQDAPPDQTVERLLADLVGLAGRLFHPVAGVALLARRNRLQRRIQQAVAHRCGVDQDQVLGVGVDPVLQGQVHENSTREGVPH